MIDSVSTLHDLIRQFELPRPDAEFPDLVACLGKIAVRRSADGGTVTDEIQAQYFYLMARVYELLGYSARHTPWLSNSAKFYWHRARAFIEEAWVLAPMDSSYRPFLHGKLLLRDAMIFTLDAKADTRDNSETLLTDAEDNFVDAARRESETIVRFIYLDAAVIARTERDQRIFRKELQKRITRAAKKPSVAALDAIREHLATFPEETSWRFPSAEAGLAWPVQHALARTRALYGKAQTLDEVVEFIEETRKRQQERGFGASLLKTVENEILDCHDRSAAICASVGLTIRAADSRVTVLRRKAETSLRHCFSQFKIVQANDNAERQRLLQDAGPPPRLLPPQALAALRSIRPDQDPVRVPEDFLTSVREVELELDEQALIIAEDDNTWVVRAGLDRYLVRAADSLPEVTDLHKQPIPFSHREAQIFNEYSLAIKGTCELCTLAIREIHRVLETASASYERMTAELAVDTQIAPTDADLISLHVTTGSILKELTSRNYPLLAVLRDRARYAWSLLEMFQMRNQAVRLGTLFSGQCQLVMANPFYDPKLDLPEDELLDVGADPIFKTTVDFVFRGAKGEQNRHDLQTRALRTTGITIDQQRQSLLIESRYLDLDQSTLRALMARLACHRSLALAIDRFTPIFVAQQAGEIPTVQIRDLLTEIRRHFSDADAALDIARAGQYPSKLIDGAGLDALHDYMKGIAQVLIGMNERAEKRQWTGIYREALALLKNAKKQLAEVGDVYLLPKGETRKEYLLYVEARILTVAAFQSWYLADYAKAAELFENAAAIFEKLHDYRVATKARARAAEARSDGESGLVRYQRLKEANAYYAAAADAHGYRETSSRLEEEFPDEEAGLSPRKSAGRRGRISSPPAAIPPQPSKEMFGDFVVELIDSGGMADVYRTTVDGKVLALKRINDENVDNTDFVSRFLTEFETGKSLSHPNIVEVYERGEVRGIPYFTMEFLAGRTLEAAVLTHETFAPRDAARIIKQAAEALDYAHGKGVIHRDLKPANVMVMDHNRVKVMDFGVALNPRFPRLTKAGDFLGTLAYASPEQLNGSSASARSDLYALGLIFYELLTGRPALHYRRRRREAHPAPSTAVPEVPQSLDEIVLKLLARNPLARYESAEKLIADLATYLGPR